MNEPTVIGIDASLTGFAVGIGTPSGVGKIEEWNAKRTGDTIADRVGRLNKHVRPTIELVRTLRPALVLIEGYSFGSQGRGMRDIAELGGVLRAQLVGEQARVVEVSPSSLKKWATGKGNAGKVAVATSLTKRYGVEFSSDNKADCYALVELGRQVMGWSEPQVMTQGIVVDDVRKMFPDGRAFVDRASARVG